MEQSNTCEYIFKRGKNKNTKCGKKNCKLHSAKLNAPVLTLTELPDLILNQIFNNFIEKSINLDMFTQLYKKFILLEQTCKTLYQAIQDKYDTLYDKLKKYCPHICNFYNHNKYLDDLTKKKRLSLLLEIGCMRCGAARITKIHWPFPIRVCKPCLDQITISDYWFRTTYKDIVAAHPNWNHNLKYITRELYNRYARNYIERFYMKRDIDRAIGQPIFNSQLQSQQDLIKLRHDIANDLGIPFSQLRTNSSNFNTNNPNKALIEGEYYRTMARKIMLNMKNACMIDYDSLIINIKTKAEFDEFNNSRKDLQERVNKIYFDKMKYKYYEYFLDYAKRYSFMQKSIGIDFLQVHMDFIQSFCDLKYQCAEDIDTLNEQYNITYRKLQIHLKEYDDFIMSQLKKIISNDLRVVEHIMMKVKINYYYPSRESISLPSPSSISSRCTSYEDIYKFNLNRIMIKPSNNDNKYLECPVCKGSRLFCEHGLRDHMRVKHHITEFL